MWFRVFIFSFLYKGLATQVIKLSVESPSVEPLSLLLSPPYPLFQWYPQSKENTYSKGTMKLPLKPDEQSSFLPFLRFYSQREQTHVQACMQESRWSKKTTSETVRMAISTIYVLKENIQTCMHAHTHKHTNTNWKGRERLSSAASVPHVW